jgi:hypothetical protein
MPPAFERSPLQRFQLSLKVRPRHPHPEGSESGVREVAIATLVAHGTSRIFPASPPRSKLP